MCTDCLELYEAALSLFELKPVRHESLGEQVRREIYEIEDRLFLAELSRLVGWARDLDHEDVMPLFECRP